jgi:uncharacterized phage infection (PIP) family protein YhgE
VKTTPAGLEQEFNLATRLATMLTESSQAVLQARSILEQIRAISPKANGPVQESLNSLEQNISDVLGPADAAAAHPAPTLKRLNTDVTALYVDVDRADAAPTVVLIEKTDATERELAVMMKQWEVLKTKDLPALNRLLPSANLPVINPESNPQAEEPHGDEE